VKILHQGFATTTTNLGGATILGFVQGNFSSSSSFKTLSNPAEAVPSIDQGGVTARGKEATPAACPTLDSAFGAKSEDEFGGQAQPPLHPSQDLQQGRQARTIPSESLAFALIKQLNQELANASSAQEKTKRRATWRSSWLFSGRLSKDS
jgi:hypothetical protein